jgi:hypothetical protein
MPLKEGQKIVIKKPHTIVGTVVQQRPGDRELPEEQRRYIVQIDAVQQIYHPDDIEVVPERTEPQRYSEQWDAELQRCVDGMQRFVDSGKTDMGALDVFLESGRKIGLVKKLPVR